jgi:hypothetical protein
VTAEGDEVVLCRAVFDVHDRAALETALANHPELERQDDGSYAWLAEKADEAGFEAAAGSAVVCRATSSESVQRVRERRPARRARREDEVSPEAAAEIVQAFRERLEGRTAYDFGSMWGELEIERPG